MQTTPRRGIQYPSLDRSDRADIPLHISYLATAVDVDVLYTSGTDAQRQAAAHQSGGGRLFWCTDTKQLWYDDGAAWQAIGSQEPGMPIGSVVEWPWAAGDIPSWSMLPYGQAIAKATYARIATLATNAGNAYGSDSNNINLPDMRGRVSAGKDDMGGTIASRLTAAISGLTGTTLGAAGGAEGVALSTAQMPAHNHAWSGSVGIGDPGHAHLMQSWEYVTAGGSLGQGFYTTGSGYLSGQAYDNAAATGIWANVSGSVGSSGSGGTHPSVQPTIVVNKIMRVL
jgi:microcystin-dependent protein